MKKFYTLATLAILSATPSGSAFAADIPTAHAYQMGNENQKFGFVSFKVDNPSAITLDKTVYSDSEQIGAGELVDGKYYAFTLYQDYLMGDGLETYNFKVYDPANGFRELSSVSCSGQARVVDMTFDATTNTMFALAEVKKASNGKIGETGLFTVDLATGALYPVGTFTATAQNGYGNWVKEAPIALACTADGRLYCMGDYRQFFSMNKYTAEITPVGERHSVAVDNNFQSMAFAPDGTLYWAHCHPDYEYLDRIDTATGKRYNPATGAEVVTDAEFNNNGLRIDANPQLTGLYFEGATINPASPKGATNFTATLRENTPYTVDLSWTLPTTNHDGSAAHITGITIYRLGVEKPLATLPADATSFTDERAFYGHNYYSIQAVSDGAVGLPAVATTFAGPDQLKAVGNLKAEISGSTVSLSWEAPTATVTGGYADYQNITYTVSRKIGTSLEQLVTGLSQTYYTTELTQSGTYSFIVTPNSCNLDGVEAESNGVTYAGAFTIPYSTGFEDDQDGTLWTTLGNSDNYGWSIVKGYAYQTFDGKYAQFKTGGSATIPMDAWLVSPAISMSEGDYKLTFVACGGSFDTHSYGVALGTDPADASSFSQELHSQADVKVYNEAEGNVKNFVPFEVNFHVATPGTYHLGLHGIGCSTFATLRIDNVKIDRSAGISDVTADNDADAAPEYYNLQGIRIADPAPGHIYIVRRGAGVAKVRL